MDRAISQRRLSVEIVAWTEADESALCALTVVDGVIYAAASTRRPGQAVRHIRYHAARGFIAPLLCTVDCPED